MFYECDYKSRANDTNEFKLTSLYYENAPCFGALTSSIRNLNTTDDCIIDNLNFSADKVAGTKHFNKKIIEKEVFNFIDVVNLELNTDIKFITDNRVSKHTGFVFNNLQCTDNNPIRPLHLAFFIRQFISCLSLVYNPYTTINRDNTFHRLLFEAVSLRDYIALMLLIQHGLFYNKTPAEQNEYLYTATPNCCNTYGNIINCISGITKAEKALPIDKPLPDIYVELLKNASYTAKGEYNFVNATFNPYVYKFSTSSYEHKLNYPYGVIIDLEDITYDNKFIEKMHGIILNTTPININIKDTVTLAKITDQFEYYDTIYSRYSHRNMLTNAPSLDLLFKIAEKCNETCHGL